MNGQYSQSSSGICNFERYKLWNLRRVVKSDLYCIWLRPISEEEIGHLKELRYAAIADTQTLIDEKLNAEVWPITTVPHLVFPAVKLIIKKKKS